MSPKKDLPVQPIQDVRPASPSATSDLLEAEIEHGIPVKHQDHNVAYKNNTNPITSADPAAGDGNNPDDAMLDHILKDVGQKVRESDQKSKINFWDKVFHKTPSDAQPKPSVPTKSARPALAILAALVVAGGLSVAAYYAFKPTISKSASPPTSTPGNVGTSDSSSAAVQAAGGTLVQPGDLSNLSDSLQSKINGLNDAQDFNSSSLSDQVLGL